MTRVTNLLIKVNRWGLQCTQLNLRSLHSTLMGMGISLEQYRRAIGSYDCVKYASVPANSIHYYFAALIGGSNLLIAITILPLRLSNCIELNPESDVQKYTGMIDQYSGLRANVSDLPTSGSNWYDIICIQETMLSNKVNHDKLKIVWYQNPLRRDRGNMLGV